MSQKLLSVPQTLQFYFNNAANNSAIDQLLKSKVPADFNWEDLRIYYKAYLSAKKTQIDYWLFKLEAWNLIWNELVTKEPGFFEKEPDWYGGENMLEHVWNEGELYKTFHFSSNENDEFCFYVLEVKGKLGICFYCLDASKKHYISNEMAFGAGWLDTPMDDFRYTMESINIPIIGDSLDLQPLCEAAQQAIVEIKKLTT